MPITYKVTKCRNPKHPDVDFFRSNAFPFGCSAYANRFLNFRHRRCRKQTAGVGCCGVYDVYGFVFEAVAGCLRSNDDGLAARGAGGAL